MGNPQAARQSSPLVSYWKVAEVTAANMEELPDWVKGKIRNGEITLTTTFNPNTFSNNVKAAYKTILGLRECASGDYIILDRQEMYHLTAVEFSRLYNVIGENE